MNEMYKFVATASEGSDMDEWVYVWMGITWATNVFNDLDLNIISNEYNKVTYKFMISFASVELINNDFFPITSAKR